METLALRKRVRRLEILLGLVITFGIVAAAWRPQRQVADSVLTRQLRIVDAGGRTRFLLAAPLPDPQVHGVVYPRSRPVPGVMFLDTLGNETGGLGLFDDLEGAGLCFDYATAEAVCLTKAPKLGFVGLTILDQPPGGSLVGKSGGERLQFALAKGASQIVLSDLSGRPRIRLIVDSLRGPRIELMDETGRTIERLPRDK